MNKLPILMYHNVCQSELDSIGLYVSKSKLEQQFNYLVNNNYKTFHFSELETMKRLPEKSVVLTFDDVTENQLIYAVPLLEKYNLKATFFIPFSYIAKTDEWNEGTEKIMTIAQIKSLDSSYIELGYHSYKHQKYASMADEEIQNDFDLCFKCIEDEDLKIGNVLAYPYGNYPKKKLEGQNFKKIMKENGMKFGLKIGNRPNKFPFRDNYEIKRIDIKGSDSLFEFKIKLRIGKLKLF